MKITHWAVDPAHSEIHFKVRHLVIATVTGAFRLFKGSLQTTDSENFQDAKIEITLDVYSVDTNETDRDEHLKSADFFDADSFPEIRFVSKSFVHQSGDKHLLTGDLTLKGVTREVTLEALFGGEAKDGFGNYRAGFEISGIIHRKDFGLNYGAITEAGGLVVGEEVKLIANVQFVKES